MIKTLAFLTTLVFFALPAFADESRSAPEIDAPETAGLFEHSCMVFVGRTGELRAWAAAHELPEVTGPQAEMFLAGGAGQVFGASNQAGNRALIAYDDGGCKVVAEGSDFALVDQKLIADPKGATVSVTLATERTKPDGSAHQRVYDAAIGARKWTYSVTAHAIPDHPGLPPQLDLIATPDNAQRP